MSTSESSNKSNGGFTFTPVNESATLGESQMPEQMKLTLETNEEPLESTPMERVVPVAQKSEGKLAKYRRLLIVLLLLLLVLVIFFWLKPKQPAQDVYLQEPSSSLPIEFRPVDAEEAKRLEAENRNLQLSQSSSSEQQATLPSPNFQNVQTTTMPERASVSESLAHQVTVQQPSQTSSLTQEVGGTKQNEQKAITKPNTTASVIHQSESAVKSEQATVKPSKTTQQPAKTATVTQKAKEVPVVNAEPVVRAASSANAVKVLTVPKGISLMQVFRDHHLSITDVNAMDKANSAVSRLKAGEKVTVHLDSQKRVTELRIGTGGRYIRQSNGSYLYKEK